MSVTAPIGSICNDIFGGKEYTKSADKWDFSGDIHPALLKRLRMDCYQGLIADGKMEEAARVRKLLEDSGTDVTILTRFLIAIKGRN